MKPRRRDRNVLQPVVHQVPGRTCGAKQAVAIPTSAREVHASGLLSLAADPITLCMRTG